MRTRPHGIFGYFLLTATIAFLASGCFFPGFPGKSGDTGLKGAYNPPLVAGGLLISEGSDGVTTPGSAAFTVPSADFTDTGVAVGDALVILNGGSRGQYAIRSISTNALTVEGLRPDARQPGLSYEVRGRRIYLAGIDGYVYALAENAVAEEAGLLREGGSFGTGDATIFGSAQADGFLYAADQSGFPKQQSKIGWRRPEGNVTDLLPLVAAPVLDRNSNTLLVGSENGILYAYNAITGEELWRKETGDKIWSTPMVRDGVVYFGSHDKSVYAVFLDNGGDKWEFPTGGVVAAQPLLFRDQVIVGSFDRQLYSLNMRDGSLRWQVQGNSWFWAGAVTDGSNIFAPSMDGNVYAIDSGGRVLWKHHVGSSIVSTPVMLPDGLVVAGKDGNITVLDPTPQDIGTSRVIYSPSPRDAEIAAPLFANGSSVFVGANDSTVTRVDVASRKSIWCFHTEDTICD